MTNTVITKLEEMLNSKGFVADFEETLTTERMLGITFDEDIEYDAFYEIILEFAEKHNLKKFNYVEDSFFSKDRNTVYTYIKNNYYSHEGDSLSDKEINDYLEEN